MGPQFYASHVGSKFRALSEGRFTSNLVLEEDSTVCIARFWYKQIIFIDFKLRSSSNTVLN